MGRTKKTKNSIMEEKVVMESQNDQQTNCGVLLNEVINELDENSKLELKNIDFLPITGYTFLSYLKFYWSRYLIDETTNELDKEMMKDQIDAFIDYAKEKDISIYDEKLYTTDKCYDIIINLLKANFSSRMINKLSMNSIGINKDPSFDVVIRYITDEHDEGPEYAIINSKDIDKMIGYIEDLEKKYVALSKEIIDTATKDNDLRQQRDELLDFINKHIK